MDVQGEIRSEMKNLTEILLNNNKTFHIPDFQRDFVWTSEQALELFRDFEEDTNGFQIETSNLPGYLLGNIVLIDAGNKWLVVDGQQRLTTLTLTFKALYEVVKKKAYDLESPDHTRWLKRLGDLEKGFYKLDDAGEFLGLKITHESTLPFGEYYKSLIRDIENIKPKVQSDENIEEVYNTILDKIQDLEENQLIRFIAYLRTKVKLIVTTAPSEAKAFQLFEVLNDRGRSLEPLDLVKNRFLKQLNFAEYHKTDIEEFNSNWSGFINNLQITKNRKINSSTFMKHFISAEFGENIKQEKLFDFFHKNNIKDQSPKVNTNEILSMSRKLLSVSELYKEIEKSPMDNPFSCHQNMFILFKILRLKQMHPLLIIFYESNQDIKDRVLDAAVRYGASILFSYTQTNTIERELPILINKILDKKFSDEEKANVVLNELNKLIERRRKLIETIIPTKDFANARGTAQMKAVDMLKFIELYFNNNTSIITVPRGKRISVEHILSRSLKINLKEYGFKSDEEHQDYLNRIGNLTLLYNVENSGLGNSTFGEKINAYKKTDFMITKTIVEKVKTSIKSGKTAENVALINKYQPNYVTKDKKIWSKKDIDRRGQNIAKLVSYLVSKK
ncbi:DUF262 domain-containing protein [Fervidibacillus halotolerans]|uniref:DUF262 domain-containing HNH endonuclease family protein n=1 Tax=Fervidibacillus halotolerans TaxID=2980027 RepID=A0A9E8M0U6_9BACI|nr:DUF262 domain-containing HNH endonuclease family protein [Fervidibacillus halotolerans]WAA13360.1 DUF262 domain-containing HNH endonuclease family protein [Fervidibacillus halotolerans]